jgi:hypothetical protein
MQPNRQRKPSQPLAKSEATTAETSEEKRAEADRRFQAARKRFLSVESSRALLIRLAKR